MSIIIDPEKCDGCESCVDSCPMEAITIVNGKAQIDPGECIECESCIDTCPNGAISMVAEKQMTGA